MEGDVCIPFDMLTVIPPPTHAARYTIVWCMQPWSGTHQQNHSTHRAPQLHLRQHTRTHTCLHTYPPTHRHTYTPNHIHTYTHTHPPTHPPTHTHTFRYPHTQTHSHSDSFARPPSQTDSLSLRVTPTLKLNRWSCGVLPLE